MEAKRGRKPNIERQQEMLRLREQGLSYREIGERLSPPAHRGVVGSFFQRLQLKEKARNVSKKGGAGL